jgi:carboxylesterase type B
MLKTPFILVKPAYRLNVFGFLSSYELAATSNSAGNFGFWDLRLALEWTYKLVSYFGGDASNITVGGYSAGAHAAFHMLAYDLRQPKGIIKRVIMHSNGPGLQPKSLSETQLQFDALFTVLSVPSTLKPREKLNRLRSFSPQALLKAAGTLQLSQFRAVSDDDFVSSSLISSLRSGSFAAAMRARDISLFIGECSDEHFIYALHQPPSKPATRAKVLARLKADYPARAARALVRHSNAKDGEWEAEFGKLYAAVQIHVSQRGFMRDLVKGGVKVMRYRIEWRAKCADKRFSREYGATHAADMYLWFLGDGDADGLSKREEKVAREAFLDDLERFISGENVDWGLSDVTDVRRLKKDGTVDVWRDELWQDSLKTWDIVAKASEVVDIAKI